MLALFVARTMASEADEIPGAPDWVRDLFHRIQKRDDVRAETDSTMHERMLRGMAEIAETLGSVAGGVGRLDTKVEHLRQEMVSTRLEMAHQSTRITALETEINELRGQVSVLREKAVTLERAVEHVENKVVELRNGTDQSTASKAPPDS